jgi:hypothetical protein
MDDTVISILAILFLFGTPAILGAIGAVLWRLNTLSKYREREKARALYEKLMLEKLDVIKTAFAMGMQDNEIAQLDRRLEQLIGADSMRSLLDTNNPQPPAVTQDVIDSDLEAEIGRQRESGEQLSTE